LISPIILVLGAQCGRATRIIFSKMKPHLGKRKKKRCLKRKRDMLVKIIIMK
jgi:hypothetical protein